MILRKRQRRVEGEAPSGLARGGGDVSPYEDTPAYKMLIDETETNNSLSRRTK